MFLNNLGKRQSDCFVNCPILLFFVFVTFNVCADGKESEQFQVYTEHLPPLQIIHENEKISGYAVELATVMLEEAGINAKIETIPWGRALDIAQKQPNVILFSLVRSKIREEQFHWLGKVLMEGSRLHSDFAGRSSELFAWVRADFLENISSIEQLFKYPTCVAMHDSLTDKIENELGWPQRSITKALNWQTALEKFFAKRCDVFISHKFFMEEFLELKGKPLSVVRPIMSLDSKISQPEFYFAASKATSGEWVDRLKHALIHVRTNGKYHKILK